MTVVDGLPPQSVVTLFDATGRAVATRQADAGSMVLDLGSLPVGVYFLKVTAPCTTALKKVVKR